ncbi:hypothetical protein LCGC14_0652340 [marine sediment metagenome]|uniref:Glutaredoxin domain-containing protein n=1 Tax=marine sediment metagenome TaxID=412755 RepID=A0A0F9THM0_9ZZZZ
MSIIIYSTETCPYCIRAKDLLNQKGLLFEEITLDNQEAIAKFKDDCPGATSVPQILIDDELVEGGYEGLAKLDL